MFTFGWLWRDQNLDFLSHHVPSYSRWHCLQPNRACLMATVYCISWCETASVFARRVATLGTEAQSRWAREESCRSFFIIQSQSSTPARIDYCFMASVLTLPEFHVWRTPLLTMTMQSLMNLQQQASRSSKQTAAQRLFSRKHGFSMSILCLKCASKDCAHCSSQPVCSSNAVQFLQSHGGCLTPPRPSSHYHPRSLLHVSGNSVPGCR